MEDAAFSRLGRDHQGIFPNGDDQGHCCGEKQVSVFFPFEGFLVLNELLFYIFGNALKCTDAQRQLHDNVSRPRLITLSIFYKQMTFELSLKLLNFFQLSG